MKKFFFLFALVGFFACNMEQNNEASTSTSEATTSSDFQVNTVENIELQYENLQLYPIVASSDFIQTQSELANVQSLAEGMENTRFRITEKKIDGSRDNPSDVNNLTVQNKTEAPVFLMAGDVVKGGRQDRVLAEDMIAMPRTIQNAPVFCVEKGRWHFEDEHGNEVNENVEAQQKKILAFTGYYNVASNDLRRTVKETKNQDAVWNKVDDVRGKFNIDAGTAYTELETSNDFTNKRNEYIRFFTGKFDNNDKVIGILAVSGDKVLGADVFGHPNLFQKQYKSLIHSYVAEAMSNDSDVEISSSSVERFAKKLEKNYQNDKGDKFMHNGKLVHYTSF